MSSAKTKLGLSCAAVCALLVGLSGVLPTKADRKPRVLFIQQDKVVAFDPASGLGAETGTATGDINGMSMVNFQFVVNPVTFPTFTFNNRVGITDTDGDQIIFKNVGTGRFLVVPLVDPTLGGNPGAAPYQVFGNGLGGPLTGTYEVLATSGKYGHSYHIGQKFPSRAVAYNPSTPPTALGSTGAVYVEVFDDK